MNANPTDATPNDATPNEAKKYRGRPILAALSGFFSGVFLALDLVFFGVIRLDNLAVTIFPVVGLVAGLALALWAPLGRTRSPAS